LITTMPVAVFPEPDFPQALKANARIRVAAKHAPTSCNQFFITNVTEAIQAPKRSSN
jgi:hypothetical protein